MDIRNSAEQAIRLHRLIEPGQGIVAAVSGGADSVALLLCLHSLAPKLGFSLYAAHLHHGIRGASAEEDMAFVEGLCEKLRIPLYARRMDVPALAKEVGKGLEEAGREARYAFLEEARQHFGADRIALAHHLDDQAESILLHLFRGSGLAGLCGMRAKRDHLIRPLLFVRRQDIEAYLREMGQPWRVDDTNLCIETGTRNRLRLEVLPYIKNNINTEIVPALAASAELLALDEEYLLTRAREELAAARRNPGYDRAYIHALHPALRSRVLRLAICEATGELKDVEKRHIALLTQLLTARTGAHLDLPGAAADVVYDNLILSPKRVGQEQDFFRLPLALSGETQTPRGIFHVEAYEGPLIKDPSIAIVDADKLADDLWVRPRQPGDRFFPVGAPGKKKLKEFFIDRKVPRNERDMPIVFYGQYALFVPGFGISEGVKVDAATQRMLRVTYRANQ